MATSSDKEKSDGLGWSGSVRYQVDRKLKRGGAGEVFRAWDNMLGRWVALKRLRLDSAESGERLLREARLQARISHRNICPVYDTGWQDGYAFIVMPYIDSPGFIEQVKHFSPDEKISLIRELATALGAAHQEGLIHGDIKPGNILLSVDKDGSTTLYLTDFGLARLLADERAHQSGDAILGSPQYMPPEQFLDEGRPADIASDIFSLGATAYEILCGQQPFQAKTFPQLVEQVIQCKPQSLRTLEKTVSRDLEAVIMKCLSKKRENRYGSVTDLIEDIDNVVAGRPLCGRTQSTWRYILRRAMRSKWFWSGAVLFLFISFFSGLILYNQRETVRVTQAASRFGREIAEMASIMRQAYLMPPHPIQDDLNEVRRRLVFLEREVIAEGKSWNGAGYFALARGYHILRDLEQARNYLEKARDLGYSPEGVSLELAVVLGELYNGKLRWVERQPDPEIRAYQRKRLQEEYLDVSRKLLERFDREGHKTKDLVLARLAFYQGDIETAKIHATLARQVDEHNYELMVLEGDLSQHVGDSAWYEGRTDEALDLFARAVKAYASAVDIGRSDPAVYLRLGQISEKRAGVEISTRGRDVEFNLCQAELFCRQALDIDPTGIEILNTLAAIQLRQAEYLYSMQKDPTEHLDQAETYVRQVLTRADNDSGALRLNGQALMKRGQYFVKIGSDPRRYFDEATISFERAISINPTDPSPRLDLVWTRNYHGYHLTNTGEFAEDVLSRAVIGAREMTKAFPDLVRAHESLGGANSFLCNYYYCRGQSYTSHINESITAYRKALGINPESVNAYKGLVTSLLTQFRSGSGSAEWKSDIFDELLELIRRGVSINPRLPVLQNCLGLVYSDMASFELDSGKSPIFSLGKMMQAFREGESQGSTDVLAYQYRILYHRLREQWNLWSGGDFSIQTKAVDQIYREGKEANPLYPELDNEYAVFLLVAAEKQFLTALDPLALLSRAEKILERVLVIKNDHVFSKLLLARCHMLKGFCSMIHHQRIPEPDFELAESLLQGEWVLQEVLYRRDLLTVQLRLGRLLNNSSRGGLELKMLADLMDRICELNPNRFEGRIWRELIAKFRSSSEVSSDFVGKPYIERWLKLLRSVNS